MLAFIGYGVLSTPNLTKGDMISALVFLILCAGLIATVYFSLIFDMADEVWFDERSLVVRFGEATETIQIENVAQAKAIWGCNPPRVVLTLRNGCTFGANLAFSPDLSVCTPKEIAAEINKRAAFSDRANQLPDPSSPFVTPPAGAGGAPSVAADH